ncbi:hypothetical protein [Streptomyces sp. 3214.6]|uniref:hypothetical protein n=1 Tax=Streptomyces sp. 3214.6 TaxID=1882757 RepID=UPI0018D4E29C|nr:hypothetical protein [Streptomyces sp. 3214.6]
MPSVMGLLEEREAAARVRAEELRAEHHSATRSRPVRRVAGLAGVMCRAPQGSGKRISARLVPRPRTWPHAIPHDPVTAVSNANSTLATAGLTNTRPYQINEYAARQQQNPGGGGWFISRLERAGADGLRSNWGGGPSLHD